MTEEKHRLAQIARRWIWHGPFLSTLPMKQTINKYLAGLAEQLAGRLHRSGVVTLSHHWTCK